MNDGYKERKSAYLEKLRDPRWQRKRLEILQRDDWTCYQCKDKDTTLHVHHCYYENGLEPWDYCNASLITLCELCHANETSYLYGAKKRLIEEMAKRGALVDCYMSFTRGLINYKGQFPLDVIGIVFQCVMERPEIIQFLIDLIIKNGGIDFEGKTDFSIMLKGGGNG